MNKRKAYSIFAALCLLLNCSCAKKESVEAERDTVGVEASDEIPTVSTVKLAPKVFAYDLVSNGKVGAAEFVDLSFAASASGAVVDRIMVKNGQHVSRGQTLATLDKFKLENAVTTARTSLERSKLDLADALIGQGYDPEKRSEIPDEVMRLARLRSGVAQAEVQLREAERALDEATLRAPFDGVIANLTQKAGNSPDGSQPFCRVMSSSAMEVSFSVLESELSLVHVGDAVEVKPFSAETTYRGKVSSINPVVDKNGMVDVCATVGGSTVGLYDGMNVRVNVKREVEKALAVPKSSVVLRSNGRKVVFTYLDGKAMWNYVTTGLENMDEYVITEGLTEGQEVIVSGNFNLAHEVPVKVVNN
jgi:RND family efflux transporter MFP subunit